LKNQSEIKALLHLLDDPDHAVYSSVSDKLLGYGQDIVPSLESYWESAEDPKVHDRIENLIEKVNLVAVSNQMDVWNKDPKSSLMDGAVHLARYRYPKLELGELEKTIKSLYRSCWLELNKYLTPLEEVNIINSIFYSMYKFSAVEKASDNPLFYYINEVLESRSGNQFSLALIYQLICNMLDIPIYAMKISNFVVLGYFDTLFDFYDTDKNPILKIQFFIEPTEGTILTQQDIEGFVKKFKIPEPDFKCEPLKNQEFMLYYMQELKAAYEKEANFDKAAHIQELISKIKA